MASGRSCTLYNRLISHHIIKEEHTIVKAPTKYHEALNSQKLQATLKQGQIKRYANADLYIRYSRFPGVRFLPGSEPNPTQTDLMRTPQRYHRP